METRANFILIGAFALACLLGAMGFALWLAKFQIDQQYEYYQIDFEDVGGLSQAGGVRFNGLPVGQVTGLKLDPDNSGRVMVTVEVNASTPIRTDSEATLEMQGVTGVSYVAIAAGSPDAPLLKKQARGDALPVIKSKPSAFQSLFQEAPELLSRAVTLIEDLNKVVDTQNRQRVNEILENVANSSAELNKTLSSFSDISGSVTQASGRLSDFVDQLDKLIASAEGTLTQADQTLSATTRAADAATSTLDAAKGTLATADSAITSADGLIKNQIPAVIAQGDATLKTAQTAISGMEGRVNKTLDAADTFMTGTLPGAVEQFSATAKSFQDASGVLTEKASKTMDAISEASIQASLRLKDARNTIQTFDKTMGAADEMMTSLRQTSDTANALLQGDGKAIAQEARQALASANVMMSETLPPLVTQATATAANIDLRVTELSEDASGVMAALDARLLQAQSTIAKADLALDQATATMVSVQQAADEANGLMKNDGKALIADARAAAADARQAMGSINKVVQEDVPGLMADVRAAAASANEAIQTASAQVTGFTGRLDGLADNANATLTAATTAFSNANTTLAAITTAMDKADGALGAAQATFDNVNGLVDGDVRQVLSDVRQASATLNQAIAKISAEVENAATQVDGAATSANQLLSGLNGTLYENRYAVDDFLRNGLPQFVRFIEEGRRLFNSLERLSNRVQRDPARFLLGTQSSEFRR